MTGVYRRIELNVFYLHISRPDLRIDAPCVELAILDEMTEKLVKNVGEEVTLQPCRKGEVKRWEVWKPRW